MSQPVDVAQLALAIEDFLRPLARETKRLGKGTEKLDDLRDVVIVFAVLGSRLGIEEIVAGDELEDLRGLLRQLGSTMGTQSARQTYHRCHAPDIGAGAPLCTKNDLGGSILAGLDIVGEVVVDPASVA